MGGGGGGEEGRVHMSPPGKISQTPSNKVEPLYNEVHGTMKITLLHVYQVSLYIRVKKQRNIKSLHQQNYLVKYSRRFCYIRPLYNEVPLYIWFQAIVYKLNMSVYISWPVDWEIYKIGGQICQLHVWIEFEASNILGHF